MTPTQHRPVRALTWQVGAVLASAYLGLLSSLAVWAVVPLLMGWIPTVVMSGSMEPLIRTGDIIAAQKVTAAEIEAGAVKKGQVLLAENPLKPGSLITHRVIIIRPDGRFTTKGDANAALDPVPTPAANIQGIERYRVPYLGIPMAAAKNGNYLPAAAAYIALTAAALMVAQLDRKRARKQAPETPGPAAP
jgi:signal peptidase